MVNPANKFCNPQETLCLNPMSHKSVKNNESLYVYNFNNSRLINLGCAF